MSHSQDGEDFNLKSDSEVDRLARWREYYREILASGRLSCQDILLHLINDFMGPLTIILGYAELIRDGLPPGEPTIWTTGEPVTNRDFAEEILKAGARQLERFNFARSEVWKEYYREIPMSGRFSCQDILLYLIHDFLQPLTIILGYAELIRDGLPLGEPTIWTTGEPVTNRDFAEEILKAGARQLERFNFARSEIWKIPPNEEPNSQ